MDLYSKAMLKLHCRQRHIMAKLTVQIKAALILTDFDKHVVLVSVLLQAASWCAAWPLSTLVVYNHNEVFALGRFHSSSSVAKLGIWYAFLMVAGMLCLKGFNMTGSSGAASRACNSINRSSACKLAVCKQHAGKLGRASTYTVEPVLHLGFFVLWLEAGHIPHR